MLRSNLTYLGGGHSPAHAPDSPGTVHPLLARAYDLWEALPDDLDAATYARVLDGTNAYLESGDAIALELLYASAMPTTIPQAVAA